MTPRLVALVAAARNGVIGRDGALPWRVPSDLARYRRLTMGKPMIMGRKTLDSIGRVLDGRDTIVLTRGAGVPHAGAVVAGSADDALAKAGERARARGADEIVIAGGGEIFALFWDRLDRLVLTIVDVAAEGDARLPLIDERRWRLVSQESCERGDRDEAATRLLIYERRPD